MNEGWGPPGATFGAGAPGPGLGCPRLHPHATAQSTSSSIQQHLAISARLQAPAQPQDQDPSPQLLSGQRPHLCAEPAGHPVGRYRPLLSGTSHFMTMSTQLLRYELQTLPLRKRVWSGTLPAPGPNPALPRLDPASPGLPFDLSVRSPTLTVTKMPVLRSHATLRLV